MGREQQYYLLFEVTNGVLISVGEEVQDAVFDVILLQVVHQVGTVALDWWRAERCYNDNKNIQ